MNFLNLQYFVVTAEEMNFTKAAKRLYITQQTLSSHICKLEEYYGVRLFDRNPPLTLTAAGQSLLKNARKLLVDKREAELELQDIKDFRNATLTIGVPITRGAFMLPPLLKQFTMDFPQVKIVLVEGMSSEITKALYEGKVDFTIGFEVEDERKIGVEILYEECTLIVIPDNILKEYFTEEEQARLLAQKMLPMQEFARCPFIRMSNSSWLGDMFEKSCLEGDVRETVLFETSNVTTMVSMCAAGLGVIICPSIFVEEANLDLSSRRPVKLHKFILDFPNAHKMIAVNYLKNKYQTKAAHEFIEMTKRMMKR